MTELANYEPRPAGLTAQDAAVHRLGEWAQSAQAAHSVATRLVESSFVPQAFRGKPIEATAAILAGIEVGLSPMSALRAFDVIQGQATPKAITLRAVAQAQGHEIVLLESTATRCRVKCRRRGGEWQPVTWTTDRAQALGLLSREGWKKQPQAMLVARATSEAARLVAADAILGIGAYSTEEIADGVPVYDQQVEQATTVPVQQHGTRRMSRRPTAPDPEPPADGPEPAPVTDAQLRKIHATYNDLGVVDRDERLADVAAVIGRDITSTNDLTRDEASRLIDRLGQRTPEPMFPEETEP